MLKVEGGYITYPPMPSYEPHPKAVENFQAACLAEFKIRLPQKAACEFCRLSNELESLDKLSNSGTNPPIDPVAFRSLWKKLTGEDLSEADALDYGRRIVIVTKYKRQRELRAQLRIILIKYRRVRTTKEQAEQFQALVAVGFRQVLPYEKAKRLLPTFIRSVWFDEGLDYPINKALADLYELYRRTALGRKLLTATKYMYRETRISLEGTFGSEAGKAQ